MGTTSQSSCRAALSSVCLVPCEHRAFNTGSQHLAWVAEDLPTSDPYGCLLSSEYKRAGGASGQAWSPPAGLWPLPLPSRRREMPHAASHTPVPWHLLSLLPGLSHAPSRLPFRMRHGRPPVCPSQPPAPLPRALWASPLTFSHTLLPWCHRWQMRRRPGASWRAEVWPRGSSVPMLSPRGQAASRWEVSAWRAPARKRECTLPSPGVACCL